LHSETYSLANNIHKYLNKNRPFVFYRKNKSEKVVAVIQKNDQLFTTKNFDETGFVMASFDNTKEAILFPSSETEKQIFEIPSPKEYNINKNIATDKIEEDRYKDLVQKTIAFIQSGKADKVVLSRNIEKEYNKENIGVLYEILLHENPDALVYIWFHPKVGLWIGATPEKMLSVHKESFSTMALAGTQLKSDNLKWEVKEKEEQQWVTDFITDQLIPIANHLEISEPYTAYAGHLAHIRTDIEGDLAENISLKDLIFKIHPTPAVCGTPRNSAKEYILKNEGYDRAFYTGFLGELNLHDHTDLYVNLRCMEIKDNSATLYIGGGITKDSLPEKEWEETFQKSLILAKLL